MERGDKEAMSTSIDERVVKLRFDNKQFEQGAAESLSTLDKLKAKLEFKGMSLENVTRSFQKISKSSKQVDLGKMASNIEMISSRFTNMGIIATTALANIANSAVNVGKKVVGSLASQAISGGIKRAFNIEQAKFTIEGLGLSWKKLKDDIDYGVKDTAYGFDEAAVAASSLAASGVKAGGDMQRALLSISGTAAMTGSSYMEIGDIFTTVAGRGRLLTEQLNQLSHRGLNGAVILRDYINANEDVRKHVIQLGLASKGKKKEVEEFANATKLTEGNIRTLVSASAIEFDTFSKAFEKMGDHAKDANQTFKGVVSNIKASLSRMGAMFAQPAIESQKSDKLMSKSGHNLVTVMQNVMRMFKAFEGVLKETGIVDNYIKTLKRLSKVASLFFGGIAATYSNVYKEVEKVKKYLGKDGKEHKKIEKVQKLVKKNAIQLTKYGTVVDKNGKKEKKYYKQIVTSTKIWNKFRKTLGFTGKQGKIEFEILTTAVTDFGRVIKGAFDTVKNDISSAFKFIKKNVLGNIWSEFVKNFNPIRTLFFQIVSSVQLVYNVVKNIVGQITEIVLDSVSKIWNGIKKNFGSIAAAIGIIQETIMTIGDVIGYAIDAISPAIDFIIDSVGSIWNGIKGSFGNITDTVSGVADLFYLISDAVGFVIDSLSPLSGVFEGITKLFFSLTGGIGRLVSGFYQVIKSSGLFKRISSVISWAIGISVDLFNWFADVISNFVDYITSNPIFNAFIELFSAVAEVAGNLYEVITDVVRSLIEAIFGPIKEHEKDVRVVNSFIDGIAQFVANIILFIAGLVKKYGNMFVGFIKDLVNNKSFVTFITALGAPIVILFGAAKQLFGLITKYGSKVIDTIKKFFNSISKSKTIKDLASNISDFYNNTLKPAFDWIFNTIGKQFKNLKIKEFIDKNIKPGLDWLYDFFSKQLKKIDFGGFYNKYIKPGLKGIADFLGKRIEKINFKKIGNGIKKFVSNFKFKEAIKGLKDFWKWLAKKTTPAIKDLRDNLKKLVSKFPSSKLGKGIKFVGDEIKKLADKLKKLTFKDTIEGFKDFGKNIAEKIIEGFKSIDFGKMFDAAKDTIGKFISFVEDSLSKIKEKASKLGKTAAEKVGSVAGGVSSSVTNSAGANASATSLGIWLLIQNIGKAISDGVKKLGEILPSPKELGLKIGEIISKAIGFVLELIPPLVETIAFAIRGALEDLPDQVSKFSSKIEKSLTSAFLEPIEDSTGEMSNNVPKMFYAVKDAFEGIYNDIEGFISGLTYEKVQKFVNLINSVLIGLLLKAIIKSVKKHNSILSTFSDVIDKFGLKIVEGADKIASAFAGIGTALSNGINNVFKGLENIEKAYEKEINSRKINNYANAFKSFCQSLLMIVAAVVVLSFIPADNIKSGMIRMAMIMTEIIAFVAILRGIAWKDLDGVGKVNGSLLNLAEGLAVFAVTMSLISLIPWPNIIKGLAAMAGVLAVLAVFFAALSSSFIDSGIVEKIGGIMLKVASAIAILSVSLALLTLLDSGKLIVAAAAIGLLMLALAGITKVINVEAVSSMTGMAGAILLLSLALMPLMLMPLENIVTGVLGLAGALIVLGAVSLLANGTGASVAISALGAALVAFGAGLLVITAAVWLFVKAMIMIGQCSDLVIAGLQAVCNFMPVFIKAMADAIADSAYEIAMAVTKVILAGIRSVADSIGMFIEAGMEIVTNLCNGIAAKLPDLTLAAVNLITSFFLSLSVAIDANQEQILSSIAALVGSILNLVITAVESIGTTLVGWFPGAEGLITGACEKAKAKVKDVLGDGSTALAAKKEAEATAKATEDGMKKVGDKAASGGENAKQKFEEQVSKLPGFQNLNNKEMDKLWKQFGSTTTKESKKAGANAVKANKTEIAKMPKNAKSSTNAYSKNLKTSLNSAAKGVKASAKATVKNADISPEMTKQGSKGGKGFEKGVRSVDVSKAGKSLVDKAAKGVEGAYGKFSGLGENVSEGYASGVYNKAGTVYNAVRTIVKQAYEEGKKAQESNSPSKLYAHMGEWVPEGYAAGIDKTADLVKKSVKNMVNGGANSAKQLAPMLNSMLNLDDVSDPVIRPVLDLSDVQNGVNSLNNMFGANYAYGMAGSVSVRSAYDSIAEQQNISRANTERLAAVFGDNRISPNLVYEAIRQGAADATLTLTLNGRELSRGLKDLGVAFK